MTTTLEKVDEVKWLANHIAVRNEMERIERIAWIKRFIDVWEKDVDRKELHHNRLCDIYCTYCDSQGLPQECAEQVLDYLTHYHEVLDANGNPI
jgi:hypothetical protein